jgi:hypothetical protein
MSMWQGMETAQTFTRGQYLKWTTGNYIIRINRCLTKKTQKSGDCFLAEMDLLASDIPEDPVGSRRTWNQSMKSPNIYLGACKGFMFAALGISAERTPELATQASNLSRWIMELVENERNLFSGLILSLRTAPIHTQENEPFTRHDWSEFDYSKVGLPPVQVDQYLTEAHQRMMTMNARPAQQWGGPPAGHGGGFGPPAAGNRGFTPNFGPPGVPGMAPGFPGFGVAPPPPAPPVPSMPLSDDRLWKWNGVAWIPNQ